MKLSLSGEAQEHQGGRGGTYFLQKDTRNGKQYWIHQSGEYAIWWDNTSPPSWMVGDFEYMGSSTASIIGRASNGYPTRVPGYLGNNLIPVHG